MNTPPQGVSGAKEQEAKRAPGTTRSRDLARSEARCVVWREGGPSKEPITQGLGSMPRPLDLALKAAGNTKRRGWAGFLF